MEGGPDELYTLRAQFWLGHYGLAIQEAKQVARRPLSNALKLEREEFLMRAYTASHQYDKVDSGDTTGKSDLKNCRNQFSAMLRHGECCISLLILRDN
jgi:coatomer protein complex subunit epsilon